MKDQRIVSPASYRHKPFWFSALNATWKGLYGIGAKSNLSKDHLYRLARKETGLQNFGSDFWEEPLDRLLYAVEHEADLHPIGRFITQQRIKNLLTIRLRAEALFKKRPEILEQPLYPVQLICGLQRTGTTKLQRLLSGDPDNRVLYSWEALNPVPLNDAPEEVQQRIKAAKLSENALRWMSPGFFSIHPVEYQKPEEDILLLDTTFMSTTSEATMHVPSYAAWLEQTDQSPAYAYAVKLLKALQSQRSGKRWVLKSPHHMEFLDLVRKHFGDVHYIWTHRDIRQSLASFLSMVAHGQTLFSDRVTLEDVAKHWVRKTDYMLSKGIAFRQQHPGEHYTDVEYKQLVDQPLKVLEDIYQGTAEITDDLRQKFMSTETANAQHRFGRHQYKLEDFHVPQAAVDAIANTYADFLKNLK
mgnify:FL=1